MKYALDSLIAVMAMAIVGNLIGMAVRMASRARKGKP